MSNITIIGIFDEEDQLVSAMYRLKDRKVPVKEVFTPYPVGEAIKLMGRKTWFTYAAFLFGFGGVVSILGFLYYTAVVDWPMNFGGKPSSAFPSFIVVTIVLTILTITLLSLFTFSVQAKLFPGRKPGIADIRATDNKFVLVVEAEGIPMDRREFTALMKECGAAEVLEKEI